MYHHPDHTQQPVAPSQPDIGGVLHVKPKMYGWEPKSVGDLGRESPNMEDHDLVTHGLHWLTLSEDGWQCANPDCGWQWVCSLGPKCSWRSEHPQPTAQRVFNADHARIVRARG